MSDAFVQSPGRDFTQSPGRQRLGTGGKFIFQFLTCDVFAHNTDGTNWGWSGHDGQQVDAKWPDPIDASFYSPTPVAGYGALQEWWGAEIDPFPKPNNPHLKRGGFPFNNIIPNPALYPPAAKSGFSWRLSGPSYDHTFTILVAIRTLFTYKPFHGIDGVDYPGGDWEKVAMRMKLFPAVSGTVTYHTMPYQTIFGSLSGGFQFPVSIPLWRRQSFRDTGDPVTEYFPDKPITTALDIGNFPPNNTLGTVELALFWLERKPSDLPPFPYLLDPATL